MDAKYSVREVKLFESLGYGHLLDKVDCPPRLYSIVAEHMFCEDRHGNDVDALRRAMTALGKDGPYRMSGEFDKLITFI